MVTSADERNDNESFKFGGTQPDIFIKTLDQSGLVPYEYDFISLNYTGENLTTVIYKTGGSGGTTVATLTLAYTGTTLSSVTKS